MSEGPRERALLIPAPGRPGKALRHDLSEVLERLLRMAGMDIRRPLVWVLVEPTSPPTESRLRRVSLLSLQVKGLTIGQFPNVPLALAFGAGLVSASTHGSAHAVARGVAVAATAVWAYLELVHGVNWFRRLLGVYGLVGVAVTLGALIF